ncbi:MAG TPA: CARDB domain-containing protein, partial [Roseiflexaceae bacterium]
EPVVISVTVTNVGDAAAGPFWVDLFINPSAPPTQANVTWNQTCTLSPCYGIAWLVPNGLAPGASITLSSQSVPAGYSVWPGYFAAGTTDLYVYADSWNPGVATGAVAESNETNNSAHLGGLTVTGPNPSPVGPTDADLRQRRAPGKQ